MGTKGMFGRIAAFEFRYQASGPAFAVTSLLFFLFTFGAAASDTINIGEGGNVLVNSPYAVTQAMMIMCVFALFILVAFVANVVVRDDETRFAALIHCAEERVANRQLAEREPAHDFACFAGDRVAA
jgi:hypothetical protein